VSVTANYQHDTLLNADNDPDQFQEAYTLIDARLGILAIDESWSISLIGKNLTNELYLTGASDSGLFAGDWGVVGKPRRAYLEVKYEF
jgi:iron complex outermembrane receptor protein